MSHFGGLCTLWEGVCKRGVELRVRLAPLNRFKPSSKIFYWPFQGGTSFVDLLCFCSVLCLLCLCARLFICALWSPAGKGLTSWLCLGCLLWVCHFPIGILGQVWYLIVSIPDLCTFPYFEWKSSKYRMWTTQLRGVNSQISYSPFKSQFFSKMLLIRKVLHKLSKLRYLECGYEDLPCLCNKTKMPKGKPIQISSM